MPSIAVAWCGDDVLRPNLARRRRSRTFSRWLPPCAWTEGDQRCWTRVAGPPLHRAVTPAGAGVHDYGRPDADDHGAAAPQPKSASALCPTSVSRDTNAPAFFGRKTHFGALVSRWQQHHRVEPCRRRHAAAVAGREPARLGLRSRRRNSRCVTVSHFERMRDIRPFASTAAFATDELRVQVNGTVERPPNRSASPATCTTVARPILRLLSSGLRVLPCLYQLPRPPAGAAAGAPPPRRAGGGRVPPSAMVFMFCSARVKVVVRRCRSCSRAASSGSIELSYTSV